MSARLDEKTREALLSFLRDVRTLPNESAKTHRFSALIGQLFPGTSAATDFAAGVEKVIRIDLGAGKTKTGRIDSYYGNAVIEFENSLKATGKVAEKQLREYVAGVWAKEKKPFRALVAIASDGVTWRTYRPSLRPDFTGTPTPGDVGLDLLQEQKLTEESLADFWVRITSLLFRPHRTEPSADQFRIDFGATSPAFWDATTALEDAWAQVRKQSEVELAFDTWRRYLTYTYGDVGDADLETLFLKHTYLASIARLMVWASISKGKSKDPLKDIAHDVLSGSFFESNNLTNFVENDFFQWMWRAKASKTLDPVWERILNQILTYDLAHLSEDVLKGVYQELVDPKDRHDLGEYYTPDWLCERIVSELLPKTGFPSVLDPSCGSGSFLRAAIKHELAGNPDGGDATRLRSVLGSVMGIDIHPLAVTIARATYLLALGDLVKASSRPIQIPVYLADSLFLPAEVKQLRIGEAPGYEIRFGGDRRVTIPTDLVRNAELFDGSIAACTKLAIDHAEKGKESEAALASYLDKALPAIKTRKDHDVVVGALWRFTEELAELIRKGKDSIWAFIVRNAYRPAMLRNAFDFIVGNPPWLSYRYIADPEYQAEVKKRAIDEYGIAPTSQKLLTQMELGTVFLAHALSTFGKNGALLGFVLPHAVLRGDQHTNLRQRKYKAPIRLEKYWDLWDVEPLFRVPSCVLFAKKVEKDIGKASDILEAEVWSGKLASRDLPWAKAKTSLKADSEEARVIYLGERTALSVDKGPTKPTKPSYYAKHFRQGATIVPRSFYFVRSKDHDTFAPDGVYWIETDPEQAEDAKPPYEDVKLEGRVEGRFLFSSALSKHLYPFVLVDPPLVVLPVEATSLSFIMRKSGELKEKGYREVAAWMEEAEKIWNKKRKAKAERQTVYQRLNYQKELTEQDPLKRHLVLYNAAGTNIAAAHFDRKALALPFVVEHKLYWYGAQSQEEAEYLVAVLNSSVVNKAIKPFQSTGLMGERDIEKKVLDLSIPKFDTEKKAHARLAELAREAKKTIKDAVAENKDLPGSIGMRRVAMRERLLDEIKEINKLVESLLV